MTFRFGFQTSRQTAATLSSLSVALTGLLVAPALLLAYLG
jgi:hypothetical protein